MVAHCRLRRGARTANSRLGDSCKEQTHIENIPPDLFDLFESDKQPLNRTQVESVADGHGYFVVWHRKRDNPSYSLWVENLRASLNRLIQYGEENNREELRGANFIAVPGDQARLESITARWSKLAGEAYPKELCS
jgi:hypothetical protein